MEDRLDIFLKSVTDYAELQCKKLQKSAETKMQKEITAYKKQASEKSRSNTSREIGRIQSESAAKAAEYESEKRRSLTKLRNELSDSIFDDVTERLKAFALSDDYPPFLEKSAKALVSVIGEEIVFYLRPCDMKFAEILQKLFESAEVREDAKIVLGGIAATDKNGEIRADDTLDSRLSEEKRLFFENADFKVF